MARGGFWCKFLRAFFFTHRLVWLWFGGEIGRRLAAIIPGAWLVALECGMFWRRFFFGNLLIVRAIVRVGFGLRRNTAYLGASGVIRYFFLLDQQSDASQKKNIPRFYGGFGIWGWGFSGEWSRGHCAIPFYSRLALTRSID